MRGKAIAACAFCDIAILRWRYKLRLPSITDTNNAFHFETQHGYGNTCFTVPREDDRRAGGGLKSSLAGVGNTYDAMSVFMNKGGVIGPAAGKKISTCMRQAQSRGHSAIGRKEGQRISAEMQRKFDRQDRQMKVHFPAWPERVCR